MPKRIRKFPLKRILKNFYNYLPLIKKYTIHVFIISILRRRLFSKCFHNFFNCQQEYENLKYEVRYLQAKVKLLEGELKTKEDANQLSKIIELQEKVLSSMQNKGIKVKKKHTHTNLIPVNNASYVFDVIYFIER